MRYNRTEIPHSSIAKASELPRGNSGLGAGYAADKNEEGMSR